MWRVVSNMLEQITDNKNILSIDHREDEKSTKHKRELNSGLTVRES